MQSIYRDSRDAGRDPQSFAQSPRPWSGAGVCPSGSALGAGLGILTGAALGAGAMYLLDPEKGADRRHHLADLTGDALETTTDTLRDTWDVLGKGASRAGSALSDKVSDAASSLSDSMPRRRAMNKRGRRMMKNLRQGVSSSMSSSASSLSDTASDWLHSARSHLPSAPRFGSNRDVSLGAATISGVAALALGMGAMWLLDPRLGRSRRAWIGQKATRALHETGDFMRATGRHLRNQAKGYYYETASTARQGLSSLTGGQSSSGEESSAQNTMPRDDEVIAVTYGIIAEPAGGCPPGTTPTGL